MTFKRSLMDNYRNRLWIVALVILTAVLQFVFIPAVHMGGARIHMMDMEMDILSDPLPVLLQNAGGAWLQASAFTGMLFTCAIAAIMGIQGFSYLYQTRSVDFYDSQPIAFSRRFFINYISSVILYAVVYGIGTLLAVLVTVALGMGSPTVFMGLAGEYIWLVILFIGMYSISVLAAVLSGNLFIAALMDAFLCGIEFLYRLINFGCMNGWFTTMYSLSDEKFLTPVSLPMSWYIMRFAVGIMRISNPWGTRTAEVVSVLSGSLPAMAICLAIGAAATALAYNAFLFRKREMVQKGLCFGFVESFVKFALGISGGVLAGMAGDSIFGSMFGFSPLTVIVMAVTVVLICVIGEWILSLDITKLLRRAWQIPACLVVSGIILFVFKTDAFGYDRYIPKASEVESCAFYPTNSFSFTMISGDESIEWGGNRDSYFAKYMQLSNIEDVEALAKLGMEKQRLDQIGEMDADSDNAYYEYDWQAIVLYRMKNGAEVYRRIALPYDVDRTLMDAVLGSKEYREAYFNPKGVYEVTASVMNTYPKIQINTMYSNRATSQSGIMDIDTLKEFTDAYEKDLSAYDFSMTQDEICIGTLDISIASRSNTYDFSMGMNQTLPIYENYTDVIKVLREHNMYCELLPPKEDVVKVISEYTQWDEYGDESQSVTGSYTDKSRIDQIMDELEFNMYGEWSKDNYNDEYFYITVLTEADVAYTGDSDDPSDYTNKNCGVNLPMLVNNAPGFLKEDMGYTPMKSE